MALVSTELTKLIVEKVLEYLDIIKTHQVDGQVNFGPLKEMAYQLAPRQVKLDLLFTKARKMQRWILIQA